MSGWDNSAAAGKSQFTSAFASLPFLCFYNSHAHLHIRATYTTTISSLVLLPSFATLCPFIPIEASGLVSIPKTH